MALVVFWVANAICILMILVSVFLTVSVFRRTDFTWIKGMFMLCILQNLASLYFSYAHYYALKDAMSRPYEASWIISTAVFPFFATSILLYWLFGFKYWVISIEVPRLFSG